MYLYIYIYIFFFIKLNQFNFQSLPYHNNIHAADVLHAMNYFISHPYLDKTLTIEEKFACIISAIAHDIDHPGVNNSYEIKHSEPLSIIYNNKSVNISKKKKKKKKKIIIFF